MPGWANSKEYNMFRSVNISEKIHWLGVNDRRKHLFENLWPLPDGVSYNSYLIADEKTAMIDTLEMGSDSAFVERVERLLDGRSLDYLIINHMELDHAGEIECVVRRYPDVRIIGNAKTFGVLRSYFEGACNNLQEVADGEELNLGHHKLRFVYTPWVHWPETMMTYDLTEQVLFSGDAFGTFGTIDSGVIDTGLNFAFYEEEMRRYYSNIVGKYSNMVQKALAKLAGVPVKTICSLHGPVWRENVARVVGLYDKWSRQEGDDGVVVVYGSMYGNTARMADHIAQSIAEGGVREVKVHDVSKTHISYLINDIWKYRGVVLGSCAYNGNMFPAMETLCRELSHYNVKNKVLGVFGSYSWNGGGVRSLLEFAKDSGWELIDPAAEIQGRVTADKLDSCGELGKAMSEAILSR